MDTLIIKLIFTLWITLLGCMVELNGMTKHITRFKINTNKFC